MKLSKEFVAMFRKEAKKAQWEINSWNGKSIDDLVVDYLERKELKPEDFTGAVILTVDEAKEISFHLYKLATLYELQILELDLDKKLIKPLAKTYEKLNDKICQAMKTKRIEQVEKCDG